MQAVESQTLSPIHTTVSLQEVSEMYQQLLKGDVTRQKAREWAHTHIQDHSVGTLNFSPAFDEDRIVDALLFLDEVEVKVEGQSAWQHDRGSILAFAEGNDLLEA